jgi:DNA invertase Pin-like site-specific DNA recombinase
MRKESNRAAIWARVSTKDQENKNQLAVLRQLAKRRGLKVEVEYVLEESAWNGKHQAQLNQALQDARLGRYSFLLVWALDRFSREGSEAMLRTVRQFRELGVRVISVQESWAEAAGEAGDMLLAIAGWVAQQESKRRSERIKAGLARRKREGKPVGRLVGAVDKKKRKRSGYVARWENERASL